MYDGKKCKNRKQGSSPEISTWLIWMNWRNKVVLRCGNTWVGCNVNMTIIQIFNQYLKRKLIVCWAITLMITAFIFFTRGDITIQSFVIVLLMMSLIGIIIGWQDYQFYEKQLPRTLSSLLNQSPLKEISQSNDFIKEEENKLVGQINGYKIILSPLADNSSKRHLMILIPLEIRPGLDDFFTNGFDKNFKFHISEGILFTEALIPNYQIKYSPERLLDLLNSITISLREKMILPLKVSDIGSA